MRLGVGDTEDRRSQAGQVSVPAIEANDRIVRPGVGYNFPDHRAAGRVHHVPVRLFE